MIFLRDAHRIFCPLEKHLVWQAVFISHGIVSGSLFFTNTKHKLYGKGNIYNFACSNALKFFQYLAVSVRYKSTVQGDADLGNSILFSERSSVPVSVLLMRLS